MSRGSDETGPDDRALKTEEEYKRILANVNKVITDRTQAATDDHIALRDAVCAYLVVEQARGTTLTRVTQILEEILRKTELPESRLRDASASRSGDLAKQLVAWCVESRGTSGKFAV